MQTKKFNVDQMYSAYFTLVIELRLEHAMIADKRNMLNYRQLQLFKSSKNLW